VLFDYIFLSLIRRMKANWIGHSWHRKFLQKHVLEGRREERIDVNRRRGRKLKQLLEDLKIERDGTGNRERKYRSHFLESWRRKRLWKCREADCAGS